MRVNHEHRHRRQLFSFRIAQRSSPVMGCSVIRSRPDVMRRRANGVHWERRYQRVQAVFRVKQPRTLRRLHLVNSVEKFTALGDAAVRLYAPPQRAALRKHFFAVFPKRFFSKKSKFPESRALKRRRVELMHALQAQRQHAHGGHPPLVRGSH